MPDPEPSTPVAAATPAVPQTTFLPALTVYATVTDGGPRLPIRVTAFQVVKDAGMEPWDWFTDFAEGKFTFLGRGVTGSIHNSLAKHLREREEALLKAFESTSGGPAPEGTAPSPAPGGSGAGPKTPSKAQASEGTASELALDEGTDPTSEDLPPEEAAPPKPTAPASGKLKPFEVGTKLGLAGPPDFKFGLSMHGSRERPTSAKVSMHFFGLAIDVDYDFNFFPETAGRTAVNNVLKAAQLLLAPTEPPIADPVLPWGWPKTGKAFKSLDYTQVKSLNDNLVRYFALIEDSAKLTQLLNAATDESWKSLDADAAKNRIEKDLSDMFSVIRNNKAATLAIGKKTGIMSLTKEIHDGLKLNWGGSYGDTMHFDMRNLGDGKLIQDAIQAFKKDKAKQEELAKIWSPLAGQDEATLLVEFEKQYPKP